MVQVLLEKEGESADLGNGWGSDRCVPMKGSCQKQQSVTEFADHNKSS